MKVYLRIIGEHSDNEFGDGRNTSFHERRNILLGGYRVVEPKGQGEKYQAEGYDVIIETPEGYRAALKIMIEEGEE